MTQEFTVFLSYSSKDKQIARDLHRLLTGAGISVWFDEIAIVPGTRWDTAVSNVIANVKVVLMLVGKDPSGEWQTIELRSILDRVLSDDSFRIIPVLLPGATIENLPPSFRGYQSIDLRDARDEDSRLKRIVEIYERLATSNPDLFEPDLAMSLNNMGIWYSALGRREEALEAAKRALEIRERLAASNPRFHL